MKHSFLQMMNRKTLMVMLLSLCMSFPALAQKITVQGTVFDETGETLIGASVMVKGSAVGVATDFDGNFRVETDAKSTLVVSYVGYLAQEVSVDGRTEIKITLKPNSAVLEEVVAIGYGTVKKNDATGSVSTIKPSEIQAGLATSVQDLLVGQTPGVVVTTSAGPEGGGQIRIRGGASLNASNDPLIVIDGVPLDNGGVQGMSNPLSMISPDNIENMVILKDASATAIYGSRASNGVIIITTKKGKSGKPQVNFSANMYVNTARKMWDMLDAQEYRSLVTKYHGADSDAVKAMGSANTDWQDEILRTTVSSDYNLSVGGTTGALPYRVAVSYTNNNGIIKTSKMDRLTLGLNLTPEFFDGKLKVNANAKGYYIKNQFADGGAIGAALSSDPTRTVYKDWKTLTYSETTGMPIMTANELYNGYNVWTAAGVLNSNSTMNAVSMLMDRDNHSEVLRSNGNLQLDYALHFLPELHLNLNLGYDWSRSEENNIVAFNSPLAFKNANNDGASTNYYQFQRKLNTLLDFYANYKKEVESIASYFDVTAGYSWQRFTARGHNNGTEFLTPGFNVITQDQNGFNYLVENPATVERVGTTYSKPYYWDNGNLQLVSFFGRLNYTLKDRYLLTFTMRGDATSRFSKENRWGAFPSVALGWKIIDESWAKSLKEVMNEWKLRLGWGVTGQQDVGGYFDYMAKYLASQQQSNYPSIKDGEYTTTLYPQGYNRNLKWEETTTWNAGFDFGFLNNRITAAVDYYYRQSKDLLSEVDVPAGTATTNRLVQNFGSLENQGVEFNITARPIVKKDLTWTINYNVAYNQNKITKLNNDGTMVKVGGISGGTGNTVQAHMVGYPASSFLLYEQVYDANGMPIEGEYVDQNGDGTINGDDLRLRYSKDPKVTMTFGTTLNWKNWDFGVNMRANLGNYVYNNVMSTNTNVAGVFKNSNLSNLVNSDVYFQSEQYLSDYWLENGSFLRCDNITLGYTWSELCKNFSRLRLYGAVQNPFIITKYSGLDPEVASGVDNNVYPRSFTFTLGLVATF
ncbi:MAG: TonB-dependent receptor [Muribaculaceae bacterium]|nr:TonB-dependent receptor [Muribaculaceae bacterium]